MRIIFMIVFLLLARSAVFLQCGGAAVDLPDANEPVQNPAITYCVTFNVDPAVTGHPIGVNMYVFHTFQGDLSIRAIACGNTLMLMTRPGGGSCGAGGPFGSGLYMDGYYSFMDGGGINPDNGVETCGGGYGVSGDYCNAGNVDTWAELTAACGSTPYTLEICFADHAFAFDGAASEIQLIFPGSDICGCTDPSAISYNPNANVSTQTCCYPPCNIPVVITDSQPESCNQSNGSATAQGTGGSGSYNYVWSTVPAQTGPTATGLSAGTYFVTVTDQTNPGCTGEAFVVIEGTPGHTVNSMNTDPDCSGDNGVIVLQVSGGSSNFDYQWSHNPGLNSQQATGLAAGQYFVTVTDIQTGCIITYSTELNPPTPVQINTQVTQPTCDEPTGSIQVNASGGTGSYIADWSHDPSFHGLVGTFLSPGHYQVTVTDVGNQCTDVVEIELIAIPVMDITIDVVATTCGEENGEFFITIDNGQGPYNVAWFGPLIGSGQSGFGMPGGIYTVQVTDVGTGCIRDLEMEIPESESLELELWVEQTRCGEDNGYILVTPANGSGNYDFSWSFGVPGSGPEAVGLTPGTYSITVTDQTTGCSAEETIDIEGSETLVMEAVITPSDCGQANGTIEVTITNGSGNYMYYWLPSAPNSNFISGLVGGNYSITVVDGQTGCEILETFVVGSSEPFDVDVVKQAATCGEANGSLLLVPVSGSGNYSFSWSHDLELTAPEATGLAGNVTYIITVTDLDNDCAFVLTELLTGSEALEVGVATTPLLCADDEGVIILQPLNGSGQYSYAWAEFPGSDMPAQSNLMAGAYHITVTDLTEGCTEALEVVIASIDVFDVACQVVAHESSTGASDGMAQLVLTNPVYPVSATLSGPVNLDTIFTDTDNPIFENLPSGDYTVTITDSNGCTRICTFRINSFECIIDVVIENVEHVSCAGADNGQVTFGVNESDGDISITWTPTVGEWNGLMVTGLAPGDYTFTIADTSGCDVVLQATITSPAPLELSFETEDTDCTVDNGTITLLPSGGTSPYMAQWLDGNLSLMRTGLAAGTYQVTLTDENGCTAEETVIINTKDSPEIEVIEVVDNHCHGEEEGVIRIQTVPDWQTLTLEWSHGLTGSAEATQLAAGNYMVSATDVNGCRSVANATIGEPPALVVAFEIVPPDCGESNGSFTAMVSGGTAPYQMIEPILSDQLTLDNLSSGTYQVVLEDSEGCQFTGEVVLPDRGVPDADAGEDVFLFCRESSRLIGEHLDTSDPGIQYQWYYRDISQPIGSTQPVIEVTQAGIYILEVVQIITGCSDTDTLEVIWLGEPIATVDVQWNDPSCIGESDGSISIEAIEGGTAPYQLLVNGIAHDSFTIEGLGPGIYNMIIEDQYGCLWPDLTVTLTSPPDYTITLPHELVVIQGEAMEITAQTDLPSDKIASVIWSDSKGVICDPCTGLTLSGYLTDQDEWVTITITTVEGCLIEATLVIHVKIVRRLFVPNVFTPNDDHINDRFFVYGDRQLDRIMAMRVYDRWGNLLFEKQDISPDREDEGWAGDFRGKEVNPGVYLYIVEVRYADGETEVVSGEITLIR